MPPFGFVGPGYLSQSPIADGERSVNLYVERIESGHGKNNFVLYGTPGLKRFATPPLAGPGRGIWAGDERLFGVVGSKLYEFLKNGTNTLIGDVGTGFIGSTVTPSPVQMLANGTELFVVSAGQGYISPAPGGTYPSLAPAVTAGTGAYLDGYYIASAPQSRKFQLSGVFDGTAWDVLDFAEKIGAPDNLVAVLGDHQELWLFGKKSIEVWYDSGAANFPFQRIQGAFIEQGCVAAYSIAKLDNTVFWLGGDDRGAGVVWRAQGYTPTRVSNHAVEFAIQNYATMEDAIAYAYQDGGHSFYVLHFPTADATWVYDVATDSWHERGFWDTATGQFRAHLGRYHAYVFGQHLVQDHRTGNIYTQSSGIYDDDGAPIRRLRSSPHLADAMKWYFHRYLYLDLAPGAVAAGLQPQVTMQLSDDGGRTWSNERTIAAGRIGEFRYRARWGRLGKSQDRCYRITTTDAMPIAWIDAFVRADAGNRVM